MFLTDYGASVLRSGLFFILLGWYTSILFSTDEELGALGAMAFAQAIPQPKSEIKYIIQLDRRGHNDL